MKCPCGCGKEVVKNNTFWYSDACGKRGRKHGVYMPSGGEMRKSERIMKLINSMKKRK